MANNQDVDTEGGERRAGVLESIARIGGAFAFLIALAAATTGLVFGILKYGDKLTLANRPKEKAGESPYNVDDAPRAEMVEEPEGTMDKPLRALPVEPEEVREKKPMRAIPLTPRERAEAERAERGYDGWRR